MTSLYTVTDNLDVATEAITRFTRFITPAATWVTNGDSKTNLSDVDVERLNTDFSDILVKGRIEKVRLYHKKPKMNQLGYLCFVLQPTDLGRLYQLIAINQFSLTSSSASRAQVGDVAIWFHLNCHLT